MTLPVNEIFETIQGEAKWTGTPSVFVRLQGCPIGCSWCDTKHTWDIEAPYKIAAPLMMMKSSDTKHFAEMTASELMSVLNTFQSKHIVITGGEPCIHDLTEFTTSIIESGRTCQIETSGTFTIKAHQDTWVTVSPKINMAGGYKVLKEALLKASEIKHPVGKMQDVDNLFADIIPLLPKHNRPSVWLQPLSQSNKATKLCVKQATAEGFKVSIQTHKFIGVR